MDFSSRGFSNIFYLILISGIILILSFGYAVGAGAINIADSTLINSRNNLDLSIED